MEPRLQMTARACVSSCPNTYRYSREDVNSLLLPSTTHTAAPIRAYHTGMEKRILRLPEAWASWSHRDMAVIRASGSKIRVATACLMNRVLRGRSMKENSWHSSSQYSEDTWAR